MSNSEHLYRLKDWTRIPEDLSKDLLKQSALSFNGDINSLGIHSYQDCLWTGAYVGVRRIGGLRGHASDAKKFEPAVIIEPRFEVDPWEMLSEIFNDDEFGSYLEASRVNRDPIFNVYPYENPILVPLDTAHSGEVLLYLSFISSCFNLCKKGLKKSMGVVSENLNSRVRGRIKVSENLKRNTMRGRNDRFYCEYPVLTVDNFENRALKSALITCLKALRNHVLYSREIKRMSRFCLSALNKVSDLPVTRNQLASEPASGIYSYYRPVVRMASCILFEDFASASIRCDSDSRLRGLTLPYMINMQLVFELYCRSRIKRVLQAPLYMEKYDLGLPVFDHADSSSKLHLINNLKPDILIRDSMSGNVVAVLDAKYKQGRVKNRTDTLQLLAYAFNTGADSCGFLFPVDEAGLDETSHRTFVRSPLVAAGGVPYSEFFVDGAFEWNKTFTGATPGLPDFGVASNVLLNEGAGDIRVRR